MNERLEPVEIDIIFTSSTDTWLVRRASISEGIDRAYEARVEISTKNVDVELEPLLGDEVELLVRRGDQVRRRVAGLVGTIRHLGFTEHQLFAYVSIIPAFSLLKQQACSRIFQEISIRDIISELASEVLDPYGREVDFAESSRADAERDYCTQYRESDADFIVRLLQEQGMCYEFDHEDGPERLIIRDDNQQYDEYLNIDGSDELPVIDHDPEEASVESIQALEWQTELTITAVRSRDFDWKLPDSPLEAVAEGSDERGWTRESYVHGYRRLVEDDLMDRSKDRSEAAATKLGRTWAHSNAAGLRAGLRFTVHDADAATAGHYLVVASVQTFGEDGYVNEFECIPVDTPLRPRAKRPRPIAAGPETAVVVGPSSEEIHTDEYGRVQVQFFWQPEPSYDEDASCWIRCAQSWAGGGWGAQFIPRVGMEVVVEFLAGNPDRPLVTGAVYNDVQAPAFDPSSDKTQSGWRSNSSPGGGGFNELRFDDAADAEEIYIHGQRDLNVEILNDRSQDIGNDDSLTVANDRSLEVGNDQKIEVGNDQKLKIGNDSEVKVGNDATLKVGNMQQVTVSTDRIETIGANILQTISSSKTVSAGGMLMLLVGGIALVIGGGGGGSGDSGADSGGGSDGGSDSGSGSGSDGGSGSGSGSGGGGSGGSGGGGSGGSGGGSGGGGGGASGAGGGSGGAGSGGGGGASGGGSGGGGESGGGGGGGSSSGSGSGSDSDGGSGDGEGGGGEGGSDSGGGSGDGGGSDSGGGGGKDSSKGGLLNHDLDIDVSKGNMFLEVAKDCIETIRGDRTREAKSLTSNTEGDTSFDAGAKIGLRAKSALELIAGKSLSGDAGANLTLSAGESVEISAAKELVLRCGDASLKLSKDGTVLLSGKTINVDGSSKVAIVGKSRVTVNGQKIDIK